MSVSTRVSTCLEAYITTQSLINFSLKLPILNLALLYEIRASSVWVWQSVGLMERSQPKQDINTIRKAQMKRAGLIKRRTKKLITKPSIITKLPPFPPFMTSTFGEKQFKPSLKIGWLSDTKIKLRFPLVHYYAVHSTLSILSQIFWVQRKKSCNLLKMRSKKSSLNLSLNLETSS